MLYVVCYKGYRCITMGMLVYYSEYRYMYIFTTHCRRTPLLPVPPPHWSRCPFVTKLLPVGRCDPLTTVSSFAFSFSSSPPHTRHVLHVGGGTPPPVAGVSRSEVQCQGQQFFRSGMYDMYIQLFPFKLWFGTTSWAFIHAVLRRLDWTITYGWDRVWREGSDLETGECSQLWARTG
jgi:hypothetical protein